MNDAFLRKINKDLKSVSSSKKVYVFADKSTKVYETSSENHEALLIDNITKSYKTSSNDVNIYKYIYSSLLSDLTA